MNQKPNQTQVPEWISKSFKIIDQMDARGFAAGIAENGTFRFGSQPPVVGRAAIEQSVAAFFGMIQGLSHRLDCVWEGQGSWVVEGVVTYTRKDGSRVEIPFVDVFRMRDSRVGDWLIYMDIAPLFSQ